MLCECCGRTITYTPDEKCPVCHPLYLADLANNNFPQPFVAAGIKLSFSWWSELKKKEERLRNLGKTEEEVRREINDWAQITADTMAEGIRRMNASQNEDEARTARIKNTRY